MERYELIHELGRGAMGVVWRALQVGLGRDVALKLISPELAADPSVVARFHREARTLAGLNHPGVVRVFDAGEMDGQLFYAMELLEGRDLWAIVQENGPLPMGQLASVGAQVAEALAYVHDVGLTHRDVKPANLFLEAGGRVVLTDFGLVSDLDGTEHLTRAGARVGTPRFLAPELVAGRGSSPASDVWALAVTVHELLTARSSRPASDILEVFRLIRDTGPPDLERDGVVPPPWLRDVLALAYARDPAQRATAAQLRAAFEARVDREARRALEMTLHSAFKSVKAVTGAPATPSASKEPASQAAAAAPGASRGATAAGRSTGAQRALAASRSTGAQRALAESRSAAPASRGSSRAWMLGVAAVLLVNAGFGLRSFLAPRTPSSAASVAAPTVDLAPLLDGAPRAAGHRTLEVRLKEAGVVEAWEGGRRVTVATGQAGERVKLAGLPSGRSIELRLLRHDRPAAVTQLDTPRVIPVTRFVCWPSESDLLVDFDLASPTACKVLLEKVDGTTVEVADFPPETTSVHRVFRSLAPSTAYVVRVQLPSGWGGLGGYEVRTFPPERATELKTFFAQLADPAMLGWITSVFEGRPDLRMLPALRRVIERTPPDESASLRRMARAVGNLRDPDVAALLVPHVSKITEDGAASRGALIQALADARRPEAAALALTWLPKSTNPIQLLSCGDALSRTPSRRAAEAILAELKRLGEPAGLAVHAMRADPVLTSETLRGWIAAPHPAALQRAAVRGFEELTELGGPGERELIEIAAGRAPGVPPGANPEVSKLALDTLARVGSASSRGVLADAYVASPDDLARLWIVGRRGLDEVAESVMNALSRSTAAGFRRDALCVLGLLEAPVARDTIAAALSDSEPDVALAASWALARTDHGARERLVAALTPDANVRARALDATWPRDGAAARRLLMSVSAWERAGFDVEPGDTLVATLETLVEGGPGSRRTVTLCMGSQEQILERGRQSVVVTGRGPLFIALRRPPNTPDRAPPSLYRLAVRRGP